MPTLDGRVSLKIPAGNPDGQTCSGCGVRASTSPRSEVVALAICICRVVVETPVKLSKKQKELLREFDGESEAKQSPKRSTWFEGVKHFIDSLT